MCKLPLFESTLVACFALVHFLLLNGTLLPVLWARQRLQLCSSFPSWLTLLLILCPTFLLTTRLAHLLFTCRRMVLTGSSKRKWGSCALLLR
jgi:hypothetical protein